MPPPQLLEISYCRGLDMGCVRELLIALVVALALSLSSGASHAQNYEAALAGFTTDSFPDTDTAVSAVAASGSPLALQVIDALQAGRLLYNSDEKKVYIREASGTLLDAATGRAISGSSPDNLKPVRVNNRVRRAIDAAIGSLNSPVVRSRQAPRGRPRSVQVARCGSAQDA